jgi:TM2 domain-containing membrane protein YozV
MIKIFVSIILSSVFIFPQEIIQKNSLDLENAVKISKPEQSQSLFTYQEKEKKNPGLAVLYSLLLPGMGELYAGSYSSGKYFTIAEGALWLTYIGFNNYGNWQQERYKAFAASNGGVNNAGKNADYYANISEYRTIYDYNYQQALDRNYSQVYDVNKYYWNWTEQDRKTFRGMWSSSEGAFNDIRFVVGGLILNRILSVINAVRLVGAYNQNIEEDISWKVSFGVSNHQTIPSGLTFNFQTQF